MEYENVDIDENTENMSPAAQNCLYYWGFAAWLAYYINHPLYTTPCEYSH